MEPKTINIHSTFNYPIIIKKWKVRVGMPVSLRQILLFYQEVGGPHGEQLQKLKTNDVGSVKSLCVKEGGRINPGEILLILEECSHPTVMRDMCAECGADLRQIEAGVAKASVPMVHSIPELKVSEEQAQDLGKADEARLINDRKLVLLVDLDQTLVHTTNDNILPNLKDVVHFQLYGPQSPWYHTRIRPGTNKFLEAASKLFELHICTFGARNYAHYIAMFLDPDGRDECFDPNSKTANLKALFPCGDAMVCIIDDREDVWNYAPNLIHVKPYHFFQHTGDIHAPPGLAKTDNDREGFDFSVIEDAERDGEKKSSKNKLGTSGETTTDKDTEDETENKSIRKSTDLKSPEILPAKLSPISDANNESESMIHDGIAVVSNKAQIEEENVNLGIISDGDKSEEKAENGFQESELTKDNADSAIDNENCNFQEKNVMTDTSQPSVEINVEMQKQKVIANETPEPEAVKVGHLIETESGSSRQENCTVQKSDNALNNEPLVDDIVTKDVEQVSVIDPVVQQLEDNVEQKISENGGKNSEIIKKKGDESLLDVEDSDDYLLYLEDILKKIHDHYYMEYDKMKVEKVDMPDLKTVIPAVKGKVLQGCELVFSRLVPSHVPLERSRAFLVAKSLGAVVKVDLTPTTTHLVAARAGTAKVNASRRQKGVQVVTPDWLWHCAERWEHVDERLYPLARGTVTSRHPPAHCSTPQQPQAEVPPQRFSDTINPLLTLSSEDVAKMDQEVADLCADSEESDSDDAVKRSPVLNLPQPQRSDEEEESEDSLSGGHRPKGWTEDGLHSRKRKFDTTTCTESDLEEDSPSAKFRRGEPLPSDLDLGDIETDTQDDSQEDSQDDAAWTLAGAALEREFLSGK